MRSSAKRKAEKQQTAFQDKLAQSKERTNKQISKLEKQQQLEASGVQETQVRKSAKERQRRKVASAQGRSKTILTSPLGVPGGGPTSGKVKTLIGE